MTAGLSGWHRARGRVLGQRLGLTRGRVRALGGVVSLTLISACVMGSECVAADVDEFRPEMLVSHHPTSSDMLGDTIDATGRGFQRTWQLITTGDGECPVGCAPHPDRKHARLLPPVLR